MESPTTRPDSTATVRKVTKAASSFLNRHRDEKGVGATFGYFTRHPVARLNRKRLKILLETLDSRAQALKRNLRVLDLACGGGLITSAVAEMGHRALGLDLSPEEIHLAKLFAQEEKLNGMFLQTDLLKNPDWERTAQEILGGKPDAVTLAYALHHLPEVESFIERLGRWLDPGSLLVINEENPDSPLFRLKHRIRGWIQKDTDTEWHRSFANWKQLLESRGFQVETRPQGMDLLPALPRINPEKCWSLVFTAQRG